MNQFLKTTTLSLAVAGLVFLTNALSAEATKPSPGAIHQNATGSYTNLQNEGPIHRSSDGTYTNKDSAGKPVLSTPRNVYYDVDKLPNSIELKVGQALYFIQHMPNPRPPVSAIPKNIDGGKTVLLNQLDFGQADERGYSDMMGSREMSGQNPRYTWLVAFEAKRTGSGEIQISVGHKPLHKISIHVIKG